VIWQSDTPPRKGFIDKEKDKESGDHNFGVRKYGDGRFTSIDPLWEKYRSWSPYHYCRNNPLIAVDPSGFVVTLSGASVDKGEAISALQNEIGFDIELQNSQGRTIVGVKGTDNYVPRNAAEVKLLQAIGDKGINVNLTLTRSSEVVANDGQKASLAVGMFDGSRTSDDGTIETSQYLNLGHAALATEIGGGSVGQNVLHETLESYIGAQMFPGQKRSQSNFETAHQATLDIAPMAEVTSGWSRDPVTNTYYLGIEGPTGKIMLYVKDQSGKIFIPDQPTTYRKPK
jgi:RHS repeat-associated protein